MPDNELNGKTVKLLKGISTNTIAGLLIEMAGMRSRTVEGVQPINPERCRFVGPAYTVRYVPIREDSTTTASMANPGSPLHGTIDTIPAGSVVVLDMRGEDRAGAMGDIMTAVLHARGVAGMVADGAMRDGDAIAGMKIPVFCAAIAPPPVGRALYTAGVQQTIGCGGVMVVPGDIVVGDPDGVVVIPRHLADEVAKKGVEKEAVEAWIRTRVEKGEPATGLYPPNDRVVADYYRWRDGRAKRPAKGTRAKS